VSQTFPAFEHLNALLGRLQKASRSRGCSVGRSIDCLRTRSAAWRKSWKRSGCWRGRCGGSRIRCGNLCVRTSEKGHQTNYNVHAEESDPRPYSRARGRISELNGSLFHQLKSQLNNSFKTSLSRGRSVRADEKLAAFSELGETIDCTA